jgi:hypothetical protein
MSAEEDITPHLIGMAYLSRKRLEDGDPDIDHEEGHRRYKVWQADVRRLVEFIRAYPEGIDRAFPPGCTNIDVFGNDPDNEDT